MFSYKTGVLGILLLANFVRKEYLLILPKQFSNFNSIED